MIQKSASRAPIILCIAAIGALYAAWSGLIQETPYKFGDTRFFYTAGLCLNRGLLPYSLDNFKNCWLENFTPSLFAPFAFAPASWPFASFISLFPWEIGKWIFAGINLLSVFALIGLAGRAITKLTARYTPLAWLLFAALAGSLSANVSIGQGALLSALGFVLALNGLLFSSSIFFVIGALLATIKFHITPLLFLVLFFVSPRDLMGGKIAAVFAVAASALLPVLLFGPESFMQAYDTIQTHFHSPVSMFDDLRQMYGISPLLADIGLGKLTSIALSSVVAVLITLTAIQLGRRDQLPEKLLLASCLGLLAIPFKSYDLVMLMPGMALVGCAARPLLLAPALIVLWRPEAIGKMINDLPGTELRPHTYVLLALLYLVVILAVDLFHLSRLFRQLREQ